MFARKFTQCMHCQCWQMQVIVPGEGPHEDMSGECCRRAPTILYIQAHEDDRDGRCSPNDEQGIWPSTFGGQGCFDGIPLGWRMRLRRWTRSCRSRLQAFHPRAKLVDRAFRCDRHPLGN